MVNKKNLFWCVEQYIIKCIEEELFICYFFYTKRNAQTFEVDLVILFVKCQFGESIANVSLEIIINIIFLMFIIIVVVVVVVVMRLVVDMFLKKKR